MSFYQGRKGAELLRQWLVEQSLRVDVPTCGGEPRLFCPACKTELGAYFGRRSEVFRVHHYTARCELSGQTWTGKDRAEAVSNFIQFSYGYRPQDPPAELPQTHEPGAEAPAGEGGDSAAGSGASEASEGGERSTDDINRLLADARDHDARGAVWEEEPDA